MVKVHQIAFKGFFLDRMGPRFLKAYYQTILDYDASIFLVHADEQGSIDAFAAGFCNPDEFYAQFRSLRLHLLPIIALSLLRRPVMLLEIARNARRVGSKVRYAPGTVELASIGTSAPGTGIGSALVREFCADARARGADSVTLTTDHDENEAVLSFYQRLGFASHGTEQRGTRILRIMMRHLSGENSLPD